MGWDGMTCVGTYLLSVCGLHMSSVVCVCFLTCTKNNGTLRN